MKSLLSFLSPYSQDGRAVVNQSKNSNILKMNKNVITSSGFGMVNSNPEAYSQVRNNYRPVSAAPNAVVVARPGNMPAPQSNVMIPQSQTQLDSAQELAAANVFPLPASSTVQVASATGAGAAAIRVYLLNQGDMNNITNNGSGAGTVTYTYQDGFSGAVLNKLLAFSRGGMGALCFGTSVRMVVTSSKAGDPSGLSTSNPRFEMYNAYGSSIPTNFNVTSDQTRKDFDTSIEVMACVQNITGITQYSLVMPVGDTATVTFYFTKNYAY